MHELGLAEGILAGVTAAADGRPVVRARVRIGALQRVVADSLQFGFELLAAGTAAEGARLEVLTVPPTVLCRRCGSTTEAEPHLLLCAACGDRDVRPVSGEEVLLDEVELGGVEPVILRRSEPVSEPPHEHPHALGGDQGLVEHEHEHQPMSPGRS